MEGTTSRSLTHVIKHCGFYVSKSNFMRHAMQLAGLVSGCACAIILYAVSVNVVYADPVIQDCNIDARYCTANFVPLESFEGSAKLKDAYTTAGPTALRDFLNKVFVGAISLGAILAVLRLAWAGFTYMSSDLWSTKEHSKEIIQDTLLGLFLLLSIWLILTQINPQILKLEVAAENPSSNPFIANQPTDI